ncbi:MAG TPA: hypothetical protein VEA63_10875, partial [Opitutus sp.]|nr:hypothetical protein [Opitutus sp.]
MSRYPAIFQQHRGLVWSIAAPLSLAISTVVVAALVINSLFLSPYRLMAERGIVHITSGERSGLLSFPDLVDVQRKNSSFQQVFAASSP